jgi:hypothetical protein
MVLRQVGGALIGVACAFLGLLPWLLTGGRLPLQNLWATAVTDAAAMPFVLLPFSQYAVLTIVALVVAGAGAAGLLARLLPVRRVGILVGLVSTEVVAIVQSAQLDGGGLQRTPFALLYLELIVAASIAALVLGTAVLLLVALAPPAGLVVGVALAAVPIGDWAGSLLLPFGSVSVPVVASVLLQASRFVPAVLIGIAVAWAGVRTVGRGIAAVGSLLILWIGPALQTGIAGAAGSRVYAHDPAAMLDAVRTVFGLALLSADIAVPPLVLALVVVLIGSATKVLLRTRRSAATPT